MINNWILLISLSLLSFFEPEQPKFKGGQNGLTYFIEQSLIYPEFSKQNCLQGTIQISFKLSHQGKVFDSAVQKGYGIDLDDEALRIVRLTSGKWQVPASFDTTSLLILPVNFRLKDFKCEQRSSEDINGAILAYQSNKGLTEAIVNFYQKKNAGGYNAGDEEKIVQLKAQLGYDDKFIDRFLREAQIKLKQGDRESACEDFHFIHDIGSSKADKLIASNCQ